MALAKVFRIELNGTKDVEKNALAVRKIFNDMVAEIKKAKQEMANLLKGGADNAAITSLKGKITELEKSLKDLTSEKKKAEAATKAQAAAEEKLAKANVNNAKAEKERALAEKARTADMIQQDKELDRQIALEEKNTRAKEKENKFVNALAGSYNQLYGEYKKQRDILAAIPIDKQNAAYVEQEVRVKHLREQVDTFNRSLTKDGTLVGEYTTGIVQAFKKMGIDDIIKSQITGSKQELESLKKTTNDLVVAYRKAQQEGSTDLNKLEKEIHDNVLETQKLSQSINHAETQFRGIGGVGAQITKGLSDNFKNLKNNIAQMALGFFALQGARAGIRKVVAENFSFEDTANQLKAITGVAGNDLERLKQQALDTSTQTRFSAEEILESFKLIASAKPELLQNVDGLIQVKDAAILLAQASGQDLPSAVDSLTKVLNQFNADASQSAVYVDALAAGAKFGAAEIPAITSALLEFGTQAKSSNVSVQESIGLIELLAEKGIQGAEAGTKLRNVLLALNAAGALDKRAQESLSAAGVDIKVLSDTTLTLEERLTELGKISGDNTALVRVFGKENFNAAQIVLGNIPRYAALADEINTVGIAQAQATDNTNGASTAWAKLKNQLDNLLKSQNVNTFLSALATVLGLVLANAGLLIGIITTLAVSFGVYRAQLAIAAFQQGVLSEKTLAYYLLSKLQAAQMFILNGLYAAQNFLIAAYTSLVIRANTATGAYAVVLRALGAAFRFMAGPAGIAVGLIIALTTAVGVFSASARTAVTSQQALIEVNKRASQIYIEQVSKIDAWVAVIRSASTSIDTKRKAVEELTKINKAFGGIMKDNVIDLNALDEAYKKVTASIKAQANAQASAELSAEKQQEVVEISTIRSRIETEFAIQSGKKNAGPIDIPLSKSERSLLTGGFFGNQFTKAAPTLTDTGKGVQLLAQDFKGLIDQLTKVEEDRIKTYQAYLDTQQQAQDKVDKITADAGKTTEQSFEIDIEKLKAQIKELDDQISTFQGSQVELNKIIAERDKKQKELDRILGVNKTPGASKLTGQQKDQFKDIDAIRDQLKAVDEKRFSQGEIDEKTYLDNIYATNANAIIQKLKLIKGANAEERKVIAELNLEKEKNLRETNQKLFDIDNDAIERTLQAGERKAQRTLELESENPEISNTRRVELREEFYNKLLTDQIVFNADQVDLEKKYGIQSIANEQKRKEAIEKILQSLRLLRKDSAQAELQDIRDAAKKVITETTINYSKIRQNILANDKITNKEKKRQLDELDRAERRTVLSNELAQLNIEVEKLKELLDKGLVTRQQYLDAVDAQNKKANELQNNKNEGKPLDTFGGGFGDIVDNVSNLFKLGDLNNKEIGQSGVSFGEVIAQSYEIAKQAMNDYFEAQRERIEEEKQLKFEQLDRERERVKARAQSSAEEETIDRQFAQKKRAIEKEAGERLKKIRRAEAKIALAAELANIAVAAAANPANAATFGVAGLVQFAVLSALAIGRFALRTSEINKQQFAGGGKVKPESPGNGLITSNPNIPIQRNGDNVLATVKPGEVILNESQQRALGGARTFRAIGVPGFANGGAVSAPKFGTQLNAPVFNNGFNSAAVNTASTGQDIEELKEMVATLTEVIYATDAKEVQLNPNKVTSAQGRTKKDTQLATL